jgi:hypothetical protein
MRLLPAIPSQSILVGGSLSKDGLFCGGRLLLADYRDIDETAKALLPVTYVNIGQLR